MTMTKPIMMMMMMTKMTTMMMTMRTTTTTTMTTMMMMTMMMMMPNINGTNLHNRVAVYLEDLKVFQKILLEDVHVTREWIRRVADPLERDRAVEAVSSSAPNMIEWNFLAIGFDLQF